MSKVDTFNEREKRQVRRGINCLIQEIFPETNSTKHFLTLPGGTPFGLVHGVEKFILQRYPKAVLHFHERNRSRRKELQSQIDLLPIRQRSRIRLHGRDVLQGPVGCGALPVSGAWFDLYGGPTRPAVHKLHRLFEMAAFGEHSVVAITFGVHDRHKGGYVASPREVVNDLLVKARRYHYLLASKLHEHSYLARRYRMFSFWWSFKTQNLN